MAPNNTNTPNNTSENTNTNEKTDIYSIQKLPRSERIRAANEFIKGELEEGKLLRERQSASEGNTSKNLSRRGFFNKSLGRSTTYNNTNNHSTRGSEVTIEGVFFQNIYDFVFTPEEAVREFEGSRVPNARTGLAGEQIPAGEGLEHIVYATDATGKTVKVITKTPEYISGVPSTEQIPQYTHSIEALLDPNETTLALTNNTGAELTNEPLSDPKSFALYFDRQPDQGGITINNSNNEDPNTPLSLQKNNSETFDPSSVEWIINPPVAPENWGNTQLDELARLIKTSVTEPSSSQPRTTALFIQPYGVATVQTSAGQGNGTVYAFEMRAIRGQQVESEGYQRLKFEREPNPNDGELEPTDPVMYQGFLMFNPTGRSESEVALLSFTESSKYIEEFGTSRPTQEQYEERNAIIQLGTLDRQTNGVCKYNTLAQINGPTQAVVTNIGSASLEEVTNGSACYETPISAPLVGKPLSPVATVVTGLGALFGAYSRRRTKVENTKQ